MGVDGSDVSSANYGTQGDWSVTAEFLSPAPIGTSPLSDTSALLCIQGGEVVQDGMEPHTP